MAVDRPYQGPITVERKESSGMLSLLENIGDRVLARFVPRVEAHATQCSPGGSCGTNRTWCYCEYPPGSRYCAAPGAHCL